MEEQVELHTEEIDKPKFETPQDNWSGLSKNHCNKKEDSTGSRHLRHNQM